MICQAFLIPAGALLPGLEVAVLLLGPLAMVLLTWLLLGTEIRSWKTLLRVLGAQLLGAWGLAWPFLVWASGRLPEWGADPLRAFPLHAALLALAAGLLWFGVGFGLSGIPSGSRKRAALGQGALLLGMALSLGLASRWSLTLGFHWVPAQALEPGLRLLYLDRGTVRQWEGPGRQRLILAGLPLDPGLRLSARPSEGGWALMLQGRREQRVLVEAFAAKSVRFLLQPEAAFRPQAPLRDSGREAPRMPARPAAVGGPETHGPVPSLDQDPAWQVRLGQWPRQGIQARSRDLGPGLDLALDTPFWSPTPRCGALLPGNRLLVQVGAGLYLLDLERREIAYLGRGQGPLVGMF